MNTILSNISYNKQYTNEISKSKYTQKTDIEKVEKYEKLEDLIIYTFDVDSVLEKNNKMYVNTKKLELVFIRRLSPRIKINEIEFHIFFR